MRPVPVTAISSAYPSFTQRSACALALLAGLCVGAHAQDKAKDAPTPSTPVLVVEHMGLSSMMVDGKDQAFKRALEMITARVDELPGQIPDMSPEASRYINLALRTLARPTRFAATYTSGAPTGGLYNYGFQLSTLMDSKEQAEDLHRSVRTLMDMADIEINLKPSQRFASMVEGPAGIGTLAMGPRASGAEGQGPWRFETHFGTIGDPDGAAATLPAVTGMTPMIRGRIDLSGLTPAVKMLQGMAKNEPEAQEAIEMARGFGLFGADGVKAHFAAGTTDTHTVSRLVIENAAAHKAQWYLNDQPLSAESIAAIPADAITATMLRADFDWLNDLINFAKGHEPDIGDALEDFHEFTGVELQNDLIANIGGAVGFYQAPSTGGGGMLSSVLLVSFKDREKFVAAHDKLVKLAHNLADEHFPLGPGHIRFTPWTDQGNTMISLRFNGLPVPLELTYAPLKDWLVISITPQGAMVAARQATGKGDRGLRSSPTLGPTLESLPANATGFSVTDTRAKLADGYGIISLVGSAVSNMVRSPHEARDPGVIVPTFNELAKDVKPSLTWMHWDDGRFVIESKGDRSMLVNAAASVGGFASQMGNMLPMLPGIAEELDRMAVGRPQGLGELASVLAPAAPARVDPLQWAMRQMLPTMPRQQPAVAGR